MKRRLVRICVFLLLGAIVNVAVAWGCAAWSPIRTRAVGPVRESPLWWTDEYDDLFASSDSGVMGGKLGGIGRGGFGCAREGMYWGTFDQGWPLLALRYGMEEVDGTKRVFAALRLPPSLPRRGANPTQPDPANEFAPLRPLWPGFAINTVFYAVVLWLLFAGPFVLRRRRRIRRGLCPKCAYDLRGTPRGADATACPECGSPVDPTKAPVSPTVAPVSLPLSPVG